MRRAPSISSAVTASGGRGGLGRLVRRFLVAFGAAVLLWVGLGNPARPRPPHRASWVTVDGLRLRALQGGHGDTTLVFLHGYGESLMAWRLRSATEGQWPNGSVPVYPSPYSGSPGRTMRTPPPSAMTRGRIVGTSTIWVAAVRAPAAVLKRATARRLAMVGGSIS